MQQSLFDYPPKSRSSDPSTSHEGAAWVERNLTTVQQRMLRAFSRPMTANEAARVCVNAFGGTHETYRKRKGELQRMGLIECVGKRRCGVTGRPAEVFRVREQ